MILLTRPLNQSLSLQKQLRVQGIESHIQPLLKIVPLSVKWPDVLSYDALITTSARSIELMGDLYQTLPPVWCVGQESAEVARKLGYSPLLSQTEGARNLIADLKKHYQQCKKKILYVRGVDISVDIKKALRNCNLICDELVVYKTSPLTAFDAQTCFLLTKNKVTCTLLTSSRSVEAFISCAKAHNIDVSSLVVLCKSEKIMAKATQLGLKNSLFVADMSALGLARIYKKCLERVA